MISFESDYTEGAHEEILKRLCETNLEQLSGYGADKYCDSAKEKIKKVALETQTLLAQVYTNGSNLLENNNS